MIVWLSLPAILAQLAVIVMQILDAGMVGRLDPEASAAIGLVASTTWLLNGLGSGAVYGFSIQTGLAIGAKNAKAARRLCWEGAFFCLGAGLLFGTAGLVISPYLPLWMHAQNSLASQASAYLAVFCLFLPVSVLNSWAVQMLQAAGNTRTPGTMQAVMCLLDVVFNGFFIFESLGPFPGLGLGVLGAALATGLATLCSALYLSLYIWKKEPWFSRPQKEPLQKQDFKKAFAIGWPISAEQLITCSAYVLFTFLVSSLGSISVAANSFAITAESLCYMPAYGIAAAATGIIGQCIGARQNRLCVSLTKRICALGMGLMALSGLLLYSAAPYFMALLTSSPETAALGVKLLRIEAFAEILYGASILATGILRGARDTLFPTLLNFLSMWCIRLPLAWLFKGWWGLEGVWLAMMIELNIRGLLFLVRLHFFLKKEKTEKPAVS